MSSFRISSIRERLSFLWKKDKSTISESLNDCIDIWYKKHGIDKSVLKE